MLIFKLRKSYTVVQMEREKLSREFTKELMQLYPRSKDGDSSKEINLEFLLLGCVDKRGSRKREDWREDSYW